MRFWLLIPFQMYQIVPGRGNALLCNKNAEHLQSSDWNISLEHWLRSNRTIGTCWRWSWNMILCIEQHLLITLNSKFGGTVFASFMWLPKRGVKVTQPRWGSSQYRRHIFIIGEHEVKFSIVWRRRLIFKLSACCGVIAWTDSVANFWARLHLH